MTEFDLKLETDEVAARYQQERVSHWDAYASSPQSWAWWGRYYHRRLAQVYGTLVAPGLRVLEMGCAQGDLLAALRPAVGVGVDFSGEVIGRAARRHPALRFIQADVQALPLDETFDVIILSDLVNDLWDVQAVLGEL